MFKNSADFRQYFNSKQIISLDLSYLSDDIKNKSITPFFLEIVKHSTVNNGLGSLKISLDASNARYFW